ncbi:MAG: bacillithiol biosynthesis cysteine-adding enzyme BshC [Ignavibacteriaceae bacterium]|nr:bacillithiol biosynthesis cysteine-adding enzyme BshC [Ignavibacteriaceae bacterium]
MYINFAELPGQSNLFLDYLYEFENVSKFYPKNFRSKDTLSDHFKNLGSRNQEIKSFIAENLVSNYSSEKTSDSTNKNLSLLSKQNTIPIVTGQQLGIITGPLYTIYKIITSIKLAEQLNNRFTEYNFLPVFWLEGDDHDFEEIRGLTLLNEQNELTSLFYTDNLSEDENRGSVGNLKIKDSINDFFSTFEASLRNTEFKSNQIELLKDAYKSGKTFKEAFKHLIKFLFDKNGLLIFDPQQNSIKQLLKPIFKKEILDFRIHSEKLIEVSADLEELYHAQVKVRPINLFMNYDGGRFLIEPNDDKTFRLKNKRVKFTEDEMLSLIENQPELFSPNVLLRPICQDYLLNSGCYIAGPGEIAYFAQAIPLYQFYGVESPIIYPRSSATIVEKNNVSILEKYKLDVRDFFFRNEEVVDKLIKNIAVITVDQLFSDAIKEEDRIFNHLKNELLGIDKPISDLSEKYLMKVKSTLEEFKSKAFEAEKRKYENAVKQVNKVLIHLLPNGSLQEREFNYFYYSNKYGTEFINLLFNELTINIFEHQIIKL